MRRFINLSLLILFLGVSSNAYSQLQYDRLLKFSYAAGVPFGSLDDYVKGKAYDGVSLEFRYFVKDKIAVGFSTGWNSFSKQYERQVYTFSDGEISAVQTRYFRSIPVLLTGHYYFAEEEAKFKTYAGLGVGAYMLHYEKWYGVFPDAKDKWSFGLRPEVGIALPLSEKVGLDFNLRYNLAFYSYLDVKDFHYAEGSLGIYFNMY